ncbi:MAG: sigma 54-interacting transcriptional regulator [Cytophagaceae bacterium]|nr:sigma 54-interacting transcriptional regulator [Cytophagaceae bacterium]
MTPQELQSIKARFGIIGNSPPLNYAIQVAAQVAPTELTVLITGESGSGKESFSKIIHSLSARKHGQFIAINCGAIPEGTIDSELFGHEKGSFTGAEAVRKGYFEVTDGGTIFLDEIAEMPLGTQARLLRVLENKEFIRVGSSKPQRTDVRVVAATNVNLLQAVERGKFREDLYYRLNTVPIFVPPLRERGEDVVLLFRKFTADFSERHRIPPIRLTDDAKQLLTNYRFPGNIRQLKNIAEQVSILEVDNRAVNAPMLARYIPDYQASTTPSVFREASGESNFTERELLYKVLFDMKRDVTELKKLFLDVLQNGGNGGDIIRNNPDLFHSVTADETVFKEHNQRLLPAPAQPSSGMFQLNENEDAEQAEVLDVTHETQEDSLSLEKQEKEMIIRALRKNNNKRKYAAQALGISERTLYRKIKQYEIEEE